MTPAFLRYAIVLIAAAGMGFYPHPGDLRPGAGLPCARALLRHLSRHCRRRPKRSPAARRSSSPRSAAPPPLGSRRAGPTSPGPRAWPRRSPAASRPRASKSSTSPWHARRRRRRPSAWTATFSP